MTDRLGAFEQLLAEQWAEIDAQVKAIRLSIAVLGPHLDDEGNRGSQKRHQIARALQETGHETFFPEDRVEDIPFLPVVVQERQLLSNTAVDLVIVLNVENATGAIVELGHFVSIPEIIFKTGVLFPAEHYKPGENLISNTVQAYHDLYLYKEEDLETCELVAECIRWASTRQRTVWQGLSSESF